MRSYIVDIEGVGQEETCTEDNWLSGISKSDHDGYFDEFLTFDIETTNMEDYGFMYLFAFCINGRVIVGRRWEEYLDLIKLLVEYFKPNKYKKLVIYVHNFSFEFQFIRNFHQWIEIFSLKKRLPVRALTHEYLEFRCSWKLSNMSLAKFCEKTKGVIHYKQQGKLDYNVVRTPDTVISNDEMSYMYCDVAGLYEALQTMLLDDTLASIPITSTGYIRRECRDAVLSNYNNWELIQYTSLDSYLYLLLRTMRRGGDCHASITKSNELLYCVDSWDIKSSYPYALVCEKYPITPFIEESTTDILLDEKAYILLVEYTKIKIKDYRMIGYIPRAKVLKISNFINDNGRITEAENVLVLLTDIDFKIIAERYTWESLEIKQKFSSSYGYLPDELRAYIMELFQKKCDLEGVDPYLYVKFKNKINAVFGMTLTDICQDTILYEDEWKIKQVDVDKALADYYKSRKSFLAYQWGIWTTAIARKRLNEPYTDIYKNAVYSDTDSWKIEEGYDTKVFDKINMLVKEQAEKMSIKPYVINKKGHREYLGVWEYEGQYEEFKTLGAKKYAYKKDGKISVTVSGLSKEKGSAYLERIGGLKKFSDNLIFSTKDSGRTCAIYDDDNTIRSITVEGCTFITSSSIAIHETTYTLGRSGEYLALYNELMQYGVDNIE